MNSGPGAVEVAPRPAPRRPGTRHPRRPGAIGRLSLVPRAAPAAGLVRGAGARIEVAAVLVDVGEDYVRIGLEGVEHAVTVVRIDVDVGDAPQAVAGPQQLDHDAAVVEDAETRPHGRARHGAGPRSARKRARTSPRMIASMADTLAPTTAAAAASSPGSAGVSPPSRKPMPCRHRALRPGRCIRRRGRPAVRRASPGDPRAAITSAARPLRSSSAWKTSWRSGPNGCPSPNP